MAHAERWVLPTRHARRIGSSKRVRAPPARMKVSVPARSCGVRAVSLERYIAIIEAAITACLWPLRSAHACAIDVWTSVRMPRTALSGSG